MKITLLCIGTGLILMAVSASSLAQTPPRGPAASPPSGRFAMLPTQNPGPDEEPLPMPGLVLRPAAGQTLAELEQIALQHNPTLAQARAAVRAAQGNWLQVGLYPNPVIGYAGGEIGNEGRAGQQGGYIGQEFVTAGKLQLNRQAAAQEIARLQQELAAQQLRVITDVRTTFYQALVAQRTIEITQQLVTLAEQGSLAAEALLQAQEASRVDLLQARVETDSTRILLQNARNRYEEAWRKLAARVGLPDMRPERLAGNIETIDPPLDWGGTLARLLSESPQLAAAAAQVQAARWEAQRASVEWVPNVDVQGMLQHDNATGDEIAGVQIAVPVPLFNRNQGNIVAANARVVSAQQNVERLRLDLQNRLAEEFRQYANAHQQVDRYRGTILPNAKESLDLVNSGYQQGEFSYLMLLTAQRTYFQNSLAYLESLLELKSALARIDGLLLSNSLSNP